MVLYCMVCHCIAWNGVVWCCMAWWSWCCMVWQRIALHRLYGVALYVMVWHSIAWFAVLFVHEHCCWDSRFGVLPRRAITLFYHFVMGKIGPTFSHLPTVRTDGADHKNTVFFTTPLRHVYQMNIYETTSHITGIRKKAEVVQIYLSEKSIFSSVWFKWNSFWQAWWS